MPQTHVHSAIALPEVPSARHLGELARSDRTWNVYLETVTEGNSVAGRLHFVDGSHFRSTGWIFREWHERDVLARFHEFSPVELWSLVESVG
jgi:hypothetical protein